MKCASDTSDKQKPGELKISAGRSWGEPGSDIQEYLLSRSNPALLNTNAVRNIVCKVDSLFPEANHTLTF